MIQATGADYTAISFGGSLDGSAVRAALEVSDEYVWIYTEQPRWWPRQKLPQQYIDALDAGRKRDLGVR